jgi:hypothetical protein
MVKSILSRVKQRIAGEGDLTSKSKAQASATIGPLSSMLAPSGRITLASLKWFFQESGRDDFIEFVQNPMLVGSALNAKGISASEHAEEASRTNTNSLKLNSTQIVNADDQIPKKSGPGTSLPYAIYPLIKRTDAASPADCFKIGRTKDNDMNMKDMAISKKHAVIRIHKGSFYIEDCGSTNGTRLNGNRVKNKPEKLHDKDIIALGNYEFTFLTPASLYDLLSGS